MARKTTLSDIWDHTYGFLQANSTLAAAVTTWSQDLQKAVPDDDEFRSISFPLLVLCYPPQEEARFVAYVGQDGAFREVTNLYAMVLTKETISGGATSYTASKSALGIVEKIVSAVKASQQLVYSGNYAADACKVDSIVVRSLRYALDEKSWYGVARARLVIVNEVGGS